MGNVFGENNTCHQKKANQWKCMSQKYGCNDGTYPLNAENKKPVMGVCLLLGYDINQRPNPRDITKVYISYNHQSILEVDETEKTFEIEIKASLMWEDKQVKTTFEEGTMYAKIIPGIEPPRVWVPMNDFTIDRMKKRTLVRDPFMYSELRVLRNSVISPNTTVLNLTIENIVTVFCKFNFAYFPFDTQNCIFRTSSRDPETVQGILHDPTNTLHSPKKYEAAGFDVTITFMNYTNEFVYDGFGFNIQLKRLIRSTVLEYYLPCFAIVVVSFISFIVPVSAIPGRVSLVLTQFLTLTNIFIHQMVSHI